jgi:hypothetical protein
MGIENNVDNNVREIVLKEVEPPTQPSTSTVN